MRCRAKTLDQEDVATDATNLGGAVEEDGDRATTRRCSAATCRTLDILGTGIDSVEDAGSVARRRIIVPNAQ
jgi:hypothetical protein